MATCLSIFHGVSIGPLSDIVAVKQISNNRVKGVRRNEPATQITEFILRHPVTGRDSTK